MHTPKLNPRQEIIKEWLANYNSHICHLQENVWRLIKECGEIGHLIVPRDLNIGEQLKTDIWASTGAYCLACGKDFGWWCPKSPDHFCHYSKSKEDCDYCHMPGERK